MVRLVPMLCSDLGLVHNQRIGVIGVFIREAVVIGGAAQYRRARSFRLRDARDSPWCSRKLKIVTGLDARRSHNAFGSVTCVWDSVLASLIQVDGLTIAKVINSLLIVRWASEALREVARA